MITLKASDLKDEKNFKDEIEPYFTEGAITLSAEKFAKLPFIPATFSQIKYREERSHTHDSITILVILGFRPMEDRPSSRGNNVNAAIRKEFKTFQAVVMASMARRRLV